MKMSIGDIVDRYSICKLKSERLNLDNSKELSELETEINLYADINEFVDKLYDINGKIWDLESDIRKGNEDILGLEEVGRRAIQIRGYNGIRVNYKNDINSKYNEGFLEVKMNHGSQKEPSLIISLTTTPERLSNDHEDGIKMVLKSLCEQEDDENDHEVHFNIPHIYNVTKTPYEIPSWVDEYKLKYKHFKVFRVEDIGPPTKFVPTLNRIVDKETIILVVDDDLIYNAKMVKEHRKYQKRLPDSVICYEGRGCQIPIYNDIRDSWLLCVNHVRETHGLLHYKSASYKAKLFKDDFFELYLGKTFSDDILVSKYFYNNKIKMFVVPYDDDCHLFETKELWEKNNGVETFPIVRHSHSISDTGCNHPEMLKIQNRFYDPVDLGKKDKSYYNQKETKTIKEILEEFNKIPRKFWDKTVLTGDEHDFERSKPAIYIKTASRIAKILGMKTLVEIGATRYAITQKCLDYYYKDNIDPFISPSCCADGHGGIMFSFEGFDVYSVDIDPRCKEQALHSFIHINQPLPENLHLHIPCDGIEFLKNFDKKIDILFLDGWDTGTDKYREKHLESFQVAQDKLSDVHLILIDDTDFSIENEGKDAFLTPHLLELGYKLLFEGRQKLFINKYE